MDRHEHWNSIYQTTLVTDVSWFESKPQVSLELITAASPRLGRVIDVGGGASRLVDKLVAIGFESVTALDISLRARICAHSELMVCFNNINVIKSVMLLRS